MDKNRKNGVESSCKQILHCDREFEKKCNKFMHSIHLSRRTELMTIVFLIHFTLCCKIQTIVEGTGIFCDELNTELSEFVTTNIPYLYMDTRISGEDGVYSNPSTISPSNNYDTEDELTIEPVENTNNYVNVIENNRTFIPERGQHLKPSPAFEIQKNLMKPIGQNTNKLKDKSLQFVNDENSKMTNNIPQSQEEQLSNLSHIKSNSNNTLIDEIFSVDLHENISVVNNDDQLTKSFNINENLKEIGEEMTNLENDSFDVNLDHTVIKKVLIGEKMLENPLFTQGETTVTTKFILDNLLITTISNNNKIALVTAEDPLSTTEEFLEDPIITTEDILGDLSVTTNPLLKECENQLSHTEMLNKERVDNKNNEILNPTTSPEVLNGNLEENLSIERIFNNQTTFNRNIHETIAEMVHAESQNMLIQSNNERYPDNGAKLKVSENVKTDHILATNSEQLELDLVRSMENSQMKKNVEVDDLYKSTKKKNLSGQNPKHNKIIEQTQTSRNNTIVVDNEQLTKKETFEQYSTQWIKFNTFRSKKQEFEPVEKNMSSSNITEKFVKIIQNYTADTSELVIYPNTLQTEERMPFLLDDKAATLFEAYPPRDVGQTLNDNLADESPDIGKSLAVSVSDVSKKSTIIIVFSSATAFLFIVISLTIFLISFQRQHGTLDIEMQERNCGKDNMDDDGQSFIKLLDVELLRPIVIGFDETEECL